MPLSIALPRQLAEELRRSFALALSLDGLLASVAELLDGVVETNAKVVCGDTEDAPNGRGNAGGVCVDVVQLGQLR